jgi:hypothetical protein
MTPEKGSTQRELEQQGWTRQFTTDEPRLSEAVALYRSLGLEVHLEPVLPGTPDAGCGECYLPQCADRHKVIYTRPAKGQGGEAEELDFFSAD